MQSSKGMLLRVHSYKEQFFFQVLPVNSVPMRELLILTSILVQINVSILAITCLLLEESDALFKPLKILCIITSS